MTSRSTSSSERNPEMVPTAPGAAARTLSGKLPGSRTSLPGAGPERVPREKTTARSRALRSSRILPGQEYAASMRREESLKCAWARPWMARSVTRRCSARSKISARRSRSGGTVSNRTFTGIKIFAEAAGLYGGGEIDVGKGNEARFDAQRLSSAEAFESPLLPRRAEACPGPQLKERRLRQEQSCRCRRVETAEFAFDGAGESAALVAEEFALHEIWRKAGAINLQRRVHRGEGRVRARGVRSGLCGTAFAGDQKSCRCDGDFLGQFKEAERCGVLGDPR